MIDDFGMHEAPHVGDIDTNNPWRGSSRLLGVLSYCNLDLHEGLASSNRPLLWWELSRHYS